MSPNLTPVTSDSLAPVLRVLDTFLAQVEAGNAPSRSQFLAAHPDQAEQLVSILATLDAVRSTPDHDDHRAFQTIGGFQILELIGRGGMGLVYKAVQHAPGRLVALKTLASWIRTSRTARLRFEHEVRIAAGLHHTHIVPIFASVPGQDGSETYAMPYIHGLSLAAVIRGIRDGFATPPPDPAFERLRDLRYASPNQYIHEVTGWVRQAAEALHAAHQSGVIHRDVKPGNLLLEFTPAGRPHVWVHDFGVAYSTGEDDAWAAVTVFGTEGYRSPEMEKGDPNHRQPQTDIYALGITLFELIVLRLPEAKELTGPVRPAELPAELARVIRVAAAADPAARYASALELANDLGRFLDGYPVRAGRPGWGRHIARWANRHRISLGTAAVVFAATAAVGIGLLARAYDRERTAHAEAERRVDLAAEAVQTYSPVVDDLLYATPGMRDRQRQLLDQARAVHIELLAARPNNAKAMAQLAQIEWRLGRVLGRSGRVTEEAEALERSIELYSAATKLEPLELQHRFELARSYAAHAVTRSIQGNPTGNTSDFSTALTLVRKLVEERPDDLNFRVALATYLSDYGETLTAIGRTDEAAPILLEALKVAQESRRGDHEEGTEPVMRALRRLAQNCWMLKRFDDAFRYTEEALANCRSLIEQSLPLTGATRTLDLRSYRTELVELLSLRTAWMLALGQNAATSAGEYEQRAHDFMDYYPDSPHNHSTTAKMYRGLVTYRRGRLTENRLRQYAEHLDAKLALEPDSPAAHAAIARFAATCPAEKAVNLARAEQLACFAVDREPTPAHRFAYGAILARRGRVEAVAELAAIPDDHTDRRMADLFLAILAADRGQQDEARKWLAKSATRPQVPDLNEPDLLGTLASRGIVPKPAQ